MQQSRFKPASIELDRERELRITWDDGKTSRLPLAELRKHCPCATCRSNREQQGSNPLHVMPPQADQAAMTQAADAELVGNYALRIRWSDGHDTGIYDYALLRRLADELSAGQTSQQVPDR